MTLAQLDPSTIHEPRDGEPERALYAAVIDRAISDANGGLNGLGGSSSPEARRTIVIDALEFLFSSRLEPWVAPLSVTADGLRVGLMRNPAHWKLRSLLVRHARSLPRIERRWVVAAREAAARDLP